MKDLAFFALEDYGKEDLKSLIANFMKFAQKRFNFQRPPKLFLKQDIENAKNILGKTAHYDPSKEAVTVFVSGRHPKDVLRSLSHELVHHKQNLQGDLSPDKCGNLSVGYAQDNEHMREMERQAYEQGSLCFRDFEDGYKKQFQEVKFLKESKKMTQKITKDQLKNLIRKIISEQLTSQERASYIAARNRELGITQPDEEELERDDLAFALGRQPAPGEPQYTPYRDIKRMSDVDKEIEDKRSADFAKMAKDFEKRRQGRAMMGDVGKAMSDQDAQYRSGKKWSTGKDYKGREVADFSRAASRRVAFQAAMRNRMPYFLYKGKTFTTKFAKKAPQKKQGGQRVKFNPSQGPGGRQLGPGDKVAMTRRQFNEMYGDVKGVDEDENEKRKVLDEKEVENKKSNTKSEKCAKCKNCGCKGEGCVKCDNCKDCNPVDKSKDSEKKDSKKKNGNKSTSKYDDNPKLKGGQANLPDALQKGIIQAAESKIYTPEYEQALYESRFNDRNEKIFDKLKNLWTK